MTTYLPGHKTTYVSVTPVELIRDPDGRRVYIPGAGTPSIHNYATQAQRCPVCKALVAVGDSYSDHTFWCKPAPCVCAKPAKPAKPATPGQSIKLSIRVVPLVMTPHAIHRREVVKLRRARQRASK